MDNQTYEQKKDVILSFVNDRSYRPMKIKEICSVLCVPKEERTLFKEMIDKLISDGKIMCDTNGKIKAAGSDVYAGVFCGTDKGFGFVTIEDCPDDVFIPPMNVGEAHDKDKVIIRITDQNTTGGRSREGIVLSVTEHACEEIVGTFMRDGSVLYVIPDNRKFGGDIIIPKGSSSTAVNGSKVIVRITDFGNADKPAKGTVTSVIGHISDPGTDILSIVKSYDIPTEFPEEVLQFAAALPDEVTAEQKKDRLDLRNTTMVTIDGEDAKDLDDAVSLSIENGIYHLGVHIADVTEYVKENSVTDREALKRGTSNYLIDSVIPMLPRELSNGICSLNEGTDRLALSCLMDIDKNGEVVSHRICETLVNINRRMNYTDVNAIIEDNDEETCQKFSEFVPMFREMDELAKFLRSVRVKRGSIDFEIPECKIITDETGRPTEIKPYERNSATKLIEDFMLIANETVAEEYFWQDLPFVYRTHDAPDTEKLRKLRIFINNFGYNIKVGNEDVHPKEIQKLMDSIHGTEEEALISRLTLRSMMQAKYTPNCNGHFGLAAKYYCHFTSPIRRYPDLQIHRIIKENLHGLLDESRIDHYNSILSDVCALSSKNERRADEAERETEKLKKVEYMRKFVGQEFDGVISGVTSKGLFVELPNTVEGLVDIRDLIDDHYRLDQVNYELIGEKFGKVYRLGEKVRVYLTEADKLLRSIRFRLTDNKED